MSSDNTVVSFQDFTAELRKDEDGGIVSMMQKALDFHYEAGRDEDGKPVSAETYLLEDIYEVMRDAEKAKTSKLEAIKDFLGNIIEANADLIEETLLVAESH